MLNIEKNIKAINLYTFNRL